MPRTSVSNDTTCCLEQRLDAYSSTDWCHASDDGTYVGLSVAVRCFYCPLEYGRCVRAETSEEGILGLYLQSSRTRYFWLNTVLMFARRGFSILSHIDGRSNLPGVRRSRPEEVFERILCSVVNVQIAYRCVLVGTGKDGGRGVQISAFPSRSVCRDELHTRWPLARSHTLSGPFSAVLESRLPECGVEIRRASCPVFAGRMLSALRGVDRSLPAACLLSCQRRVSKLQKTVAYLISRTPDRLVLITSSGVVVERRLPSRWCHHRASRRTLPPRSLHSMLRTVRGSALLQRAFLEHLDADGMSEKNSS